jgi:hypothetical protein
LALYAQQLTALRAQEEGPIASEIASLSEQRARLLGDQARTAEKVESAQEEGAAADLENERQVGGVDGRPRGDGRLANDAAKQKELAGQQVRFLAEHKKDLAQDSDRLAQQIAAARQQQEQIQPRYIEAAHRLEQERDGRLIQPTSGPLTVVLGLMKLRDDPEKGPAVWAVTVAAWSSVMVLELAFFLVRTVFRSASNHDFALNIDVQRRAAREVHRFAADVRDVRQRQPLRVVGGDAQNP